MNVYIKQLTSSAICRLASKPRGNSTVQRLQCNSSAIKTQPRTTEKNPLLLPCTTTGYNRVPHTILPAHNVCASHSPWRGDFWGGTHHTSLLQPNTFSVAHVQEKSAWQAGIPSPFSRLHLWLGQGLLHFIVQLLADACRNNIKSAGSLI